MKLNIELDLPYLITIDKLLTVIHCYSTISKRTSDNNGIVDVIDLDILKFTVTELLNEIDTKIASHPDAKAQEAFDKYVTTGKYKSLTEADSKLHRQIINSQIKPGFPDF